MEFTSAENLQQLQARATLERFAMDDASARIYKHFAIFILFLILLDWVLATRFGLVHRSVLFSSFAEFTTLLKADIVEQHSSII